MPILGVPVWQRRLKTPGQSDIPESLHWGMAEFPNMMYA